MGVRFVMRGYLPHPAKCGSCGATDRDCLDFGVTVEFYGALMLCTTCVSWAVREFGTELGVASLEDYVQLQEEADTLRVKLAMVPTALEALRAAVDSAHRQFDAQLHDDPPVVREPEESVEPEPAPDGDSGTEPETDPLFDIGSPGLDPAPVGSTGNEGSDVVPGSKRPRKRGSSTTTFDI